MSTSDLIEGEKKYPPPVGMTKSIRLEEAIYIRILIQQNHLL
jgi:hypothetical protein